METLLWAGFLQGYKYNPHILFQLNGSKWLMTEKDTKRQLFDKISLGACYAINADGIFVAIFHQFSSVSL